MQCLLPIFGLIFLATVGHPAPNPQREREAAIANPLGSLLSQLRGIQEARGQLVQALLLPPSRITRPKPNRLPITNSNRLKDAEEEQEEEPKERPSPAASRPNRRRPANRRPNRPTVSDQEGQFADDSEFDEVAPEERKPVKKTKPAKSTTEAPEDEDEPRNEVTTQKSKRRRPSGNRVKPDKQNEQPELETDADDGEDQLSTRNQPVTTEKSNKKRRPSNRNKPEQNAEENEKSGDLPTFGGLPPPPSGPVPTHIEEMPTVQNDEAPQGIKNLTRTILGAPCLGGVGHDGSCREEW